ncbi:MAG: sulfatase-like hydrolase/transferase [Alphaproteobacteria bacterium]|nr:sulfatase-like hydrolase/transferase [Alphaproteobacteria bacterium]
MADAPKGLKLSDIRNYFSALSYKERCAVAARATMVLFCWLIMFVMSKKLSINEYQLFLSVISLFGMGLFFNSVLFLIFYWAIFLPLTLDLHLFLAYGLSLHSFGKQLFAILCDTNKIEIIEYLPKITFFEWISVISMFSASVCVLLFKPQPIKIPKEWKRTIFFVLFAVYPLTYIAHIYPIIQSKFSAEENELIAKALAFHFNPAKQNKADTVVVLIGESHRQEEFGPAFDKYASEFQSLYRFSDMISPFAGTLNTVPIILSRKKGDNAHNFFYEKSLFSLFEEAGYSTYFVQYTEISSELNKLSFIYREANHFVKYENKEKKEATDEGIYSVLEDILNNGERKKLIVIKMIGVHIDFIRRYPDPNISSLQRFWFALKSRTKEREMYHYNKAISYSAGVIANIMKKIEKRPEPSLLFFSSDHGICIFDKGSFQLPPNCRNAFHIPAMILLNPALSAITSQQAKNNLDCNQDKPLTEEYDFETIAALAGISYPTADKQYELTGQCDPLHGKKRLVSTGSIKEKRTFYEDL